VLPPPQAPPPDASAPLARIVASEADGHRRLEARVSMPDGSGRPLVWRLQAQVSRHGNSSTVAQSGRTDGRASGPVGVVTVDAGGAGSARLSVSTPEGQPVAADTLEWGAPGARP
jgi:hypothetical protein